VREKRRVVVTGVGTVTALGSCVSEMWPKLASGQSGVRYVGDDSLCVPLGATPDYQSIEKFGSMDACSGFSLLAAEEAVRDAGLSEDALREMDIVFGTSKGGLRSFERASAALRRHGPIGLPPSFLNDFVTNAASDRIAAHLGSMGSRLNFVSACATGTHSIIMAARRIAAGKSRITLAGSGEASLTPLVVAAFDRMGVLSHGTAEPMTAMRPYHRRRDGFVIGEGSGAMVLESLESALERGARIRAEVKGWALGGEAHHLSAMDPSGQSIASRIRYALDMARIEARDLNYINSHGTATQQNDVVETRSFKLALGDNARNVPISSTKPMTGHLLGATGSVEAVITILAIENNFVPPTINLDEPDPECDLNYTPNVGVSRPVQTALTLNYGFGGQIAAIVLAKFNA